jgi:putative oxidoreductase
MDYGRFNWTHLLMRVSLGAVFIYAAVFKLFLDAAPPMKKIIYFMPPETSIAVLGIIEFALGIMLVLGLLTRVVASITAVLLTAFIISAVVLGLFVTQFIVKDIVLFAVAVHFIMHGCKGMGLDCLIRNL